MKPCHECGDQIRSGTRCRPCSIITFPIMELAHRAVAIGVRHGHLTSLLANEIACVDCGVRATQYDHRDYTKPLEVEPVCRKCNKARGPAAPLLRQLEAA